MLLHLSIAMLASLSPIAVSDAVPRLDIAKECHYEGGLTETFDRCSRDEADALQQLQAEWLKFTEADRTACFGEATIAGIASYVDLLVCLEMARDVRNITPDPRDARAKQSPRPAQAETPVIDKPD